MRILPPVLLLLGGAAYGADTDEGAGVVQIPTPLQGPSGSLPVGTGDRYDPANNELCVPAVSLGSSTYYNVAVSYGTTTTGGPSRDGSSYGTVFKFTRPVMLIPSEGRNAC